MNRKSILALMTIVLLALLAAGCGSQQADQEVEAIDEVDFGNIVSASGKVMPVRWAELAFESGGRLLTIVEEGADVSEGAQLGEVESVDLQQAVIMAEASLAVAQAQLDQALAGARAEDLAAADGAVEAAVGRVTAAKGGLERTKSDSGSSVKAAEAQVAAAEAELNRAQAELALIQAGARPEEIASLQARVNQLQSEFLIAENVHFDNFIDKDIGGGPEERARYARESARNARDAAQAELDLARAGASAEAVAAAAAGVRAAQAQVAAAEAALEKAQAGSADVTMAQAQVQIASGELAQAQASYDKLAHGNSPTDIAVLEAEVHRAEAALSQARADLEKAHIRAPFAGTVGSVLYKTGEFVQAGMPVLVLGDTGSLRVETSDLNEVDAAQVGLGSTVSLTFDALPGMTTRGEIVRVAPMASAGQGGTNFTAIIEMENPPADLRWGMTAFVDIEVEQQ